MKVWQMVPVEPTPLKPKEVIRKHLEDTVGLGGFDAYRALMKTKSEVMRSTLKSSKKLKRAYVLGSQKTRDEIRRKIEERVNEKYDNLFKEYAPGGGVVTAATLARYEGELPPHLLREAMWQKQNAPKVPLRDHGTELYFQAIINKEMGWDELEDNDFLNLAEMYVDRHPLYRKSEEFKAISSRAAEMRKKMAMELSAKGTELQPMGRLTHDLTSPTWMAIAEAAREALPIPVTDEEQSIRDTARVLYQLEGEDFGTAKVVGLMSGVVGVYGNAYRQLAKKGLTSIIGEGAKQKAKSFAALAAVEVGVDRIYNPEGHSIINMIFNEGEPNRLLSMAESIAIGTIFNLGFDAVRGMKGMKRSEVAGYLENKLPYSKNELLKIDPKNPPPGWHRTFEPPKVSKEVAEKVTALTKRSGALEEEIHQFALKIHKRADERWFRKEGLTREHIREKYLWTKPTNKQMARMTSLTEELKDVQNQIKSLVRTPDEAAAMERTVGRAWEKARGVAKTEPLRLEAKEQLRLPVRGAVSEAERLSRAIEDNAARHEFLKNRAVELRVQAREFINAGRKEEGLALAAKGSALDAERMAIEPSSLTPLGLRGARREEVVRGARGVEDAGRAGEAIPLKRTMQDTVDDVVAGQERHKNKLAHQEKSLGAVADVATDGVTGFKPLIDDIPEEVMAAMRKEIARISPTRIAKPTEVLEQLQLKDAAKLRRVLHNAQNELKTSNERIALAKAAAEQTEAAVTTPTKGGLRVDPWTQQGIADIATREMFTYPAVAKELAIRAGFGHATGTLAEDEGYGYWSGWMFGFSQFNPRFLNIRGMKSLGIQTPPIRQGKVDAVLEQIMTAVEKIHPRPAMRLMKYETKVGSIPIVLGEQGGKYYKSLDEAMERGVISEAERKNMSDMVLDIGRDPKMRLKIEEVGDRMAASGRTTIVNGQELTDQFNVAMTITDTLADEFRMTGGKIGHLPWYHPRAVKSDKVDKYNKVMGIEKKSVIDEAVRDFENDVLGRKLDMSVKLDKKMRKSVANAATNDLGAGMRAIHKPSNVQARKMARIEEKARPFYEGDHASFIAYVNEMVYSIEKNKLFGRGAKASELAKGKRLPTGAERELDDSIGGILTSLRYPDKMLPSGTVIRYADGTTRTLVDDVFFKKFQVGNVKQLAKGEERRLAQVAETRGKITQPQEDMVMQLFQRRFAGGRQPIGPWIQAARAATHALTIGQFSSTLVQTSDLGLIAHTEGLRAAMKMAGEGSEHVFNNAMRHLTKGKFNKARPDNLIYLREQFGIGNLAMEMFDGGRHGGFSAGAEKATRGILKYTGFTTFDGIMKTAKLNATLYNIRKGIKTRVTAGGKTIHDVSPEIRARFGEAFGKDFDDLVEAVAKKDWNNWNLKTAVLMELGKIQPVTMSNMPAVYITAGGFGRFCYTLKTFQMTYVNHLRRSVVSKIWHGTKKLKNPATRKEGLKQWKEGSANLVKLFAYFGGMTAGVNTLTDFINGRRFEPSRAGLDAILTASGFSRFQIYDYLRRANPVYGGRGRGPEPFSAALQTLAVTVAPPLLGVAETMLQDVVRVIDGESWKKIESVKYLPFAGKIIHGRFGAGDLRDREAERKAAKKSGGSKMPVLH